MDTRPRSPANPVSDFLFSTAPRPPGALRDALGLFVSPAGAEVAEMHGAWGSLAVARAPHDPEPVTRDDRALSVLIGEPVAHLSGSGPAAEDPRRAAIHAALAADEATAWDTVLDGPFAALVIDLEQGAGSVITDLFAWVPLFAAEADGGLLVGTHVDAVAAVARAEVDPVSAAELVAHLTITWPRTLYHGVEQVAPGTERRFGPGGWAGEGRAYWRPEERFPYRTIDEAAEVLRDALVRDVAVAVEGRESVGLLLSGGEDSRVVLGALPKGVSVTGFTYADAENREVRSARRVTRAYGAAFVFGRREPDHYLRGMEPVAALVGSQNEYIDAHGYGFHTRLGLAELDVVLGGLSSDALLKCDNVPPRHYAQVLRGEVPEIRRLPIPKMRGIRPALLEEAAERRNAFRRGLAALRPESADEWSRIYPFTMRKYAANHHGNRRMFRAHEPFMCNAVVKLAAAVPQRWKLHRRLFHRAVRPLLAPSWYVPHTRNRFPSLPGPANAIARPLLGLARDLRALAGGRWGANEESWPVWERLVESPAMAQAEARHAVLRSALRLVIDADDEAQALAAMRTWAPRQRLTALQVAFLTRA
jgi:Asparagine synthase